MRRSLVLAAAVAAATVTALPDRAGVGLGIPRPAASSQPAGVPLDSSRVSAAAVGGVIDAGARQDGMRPAVGQAADNSCPEPVIPTSYGHVLFQDLFDSLDRVICKISPVAKAGQTDVSSREESLDRLSAATASRGGDFPHLKSPRSVAEIRNSGGFPVVPATQSSAAELAAATSPALAPPPYAASVMESPRYDPAVGEKDAAPTAHTYVRGVTEHLLRMAAAKGARVHEPLGAFGARPASSLASQMLKGTSTGLQEAKRLLLGEVENDSDDTSSSEVEERSDRVLRVIPGLAPRKETRQAAANGMDVPVKGEGRGGDGDAKGAARDLGFVTPQKQVQGRGDDEDSPVTYRAAQASPWQGHSRGQKTALDETLPAPRLHGHQPLASRRGPGAAAASDGPQPASVRSENQDDELRERSAVPGEKQDHIRMGEMARLDAGVQAKPAQLLVQQVPSGEILGRDERWDQHVGVNSRIGAQDMDVSTDGGDLVAGRVESAVVETLQVNATASAAGGRLTIESSGTQVSSARAPAGRIRIPGLTVSSSSGLPSWAKPRLLQALSLAAAGVACWKVLGVTLPARNYSPVRVYSGYSLLDVPLTIMDTILVDASDVI